MKKKSDFGGRIFPPLKKLLMIMKLSIILLLLSLLQVSAGVYGQNTLLNLKMQNVTVAEVFDRIEDQTDYYFFYNRDEFHDKEIVSVDFTNKNIHEILDKILAGKSLDYKMVGSNIIIKAKGQAENKTSQQGSVSGKITDPSGASLPGVSVVVRGTAHGTITGVDGSYSLMNVPANSVLVFSFVGMKKLEVDIAGRTLLNVVMEEETIGIEEVVAVGYGTMKKSDLTGSVSSVSNRLFAAQPMVRATEALQGRVAGVDVTTMNGRPDGGIKIRVRGITSINKSNDPLVIIDGVSGSMGTVNTDDIQSIEILKDASSTAVYGSRGANGVILITTKRGAEGRSVVTFDSQTGWGNVTNTYNMMSPYEFAQAQRVIKPASITDDAVESFRDGTKGIRWWDSVTRPSLTQNNKVSVSGGTANTKYIISANVIDQNSNIIEARYAKQILRANLDTKVYKWLRINTDLSAFRTHMKNADSGASVWGFMSYNPAMEMKDPVTGIYNNDNVKMLVLPNYYGAQMVNKNDSYNNSFRALTDLTFYIIDGLTFSALGYIGLGDSQSYSFSSALAAPGATDNANNSYAHSLSWQNTNNLTYQKTFGDHSITATGVLELISNESRSLTGSATNLQNGPTVGYWNLANGAGRNASNAYSASSLVSYFGRFNYSYKSRYRITATIRADGSSRFQGDNKWGYFPSGAVAWNVAEESFMKGQSLFQQLKLRASYGVVGNQAIANYNTLGMLASTTYAYSTMTGVTGYWGKNLPTPDLSWETTKQWDAGVDAGMFDQRLNFTLDWYVKNTTDLLFQKTIPAYNGSGTFWTNAGELKNTGIEMMIDAYPVKKSKLTWSSVLTAAWQKNEVVDLAGLNFLNGTVGYSGTFESTTRLEPGKPIGSFWVLDFGGYDSNGFAQYKAADGTLTKTPTNADRIMKGNSNPTWNFGWNNMVSFGNWEASVFFTAVAGNSRLNLLKSYMASGIPVYREAWYQSWDYLKQHGGNLDDAVIGTKLTSGNRESSMNYHGSTRILEDASYLRLKNVSIAYRIPKKTAKFADVRLSISAQNLFVLTRYSGLDPESVNTLMGDASNAIDLNNGLDLGAFPLPRVFTVGVNVNF